MIQWNELEPDAQPEQLSRLLRVLDWASAATVLLNSQSGCHIYISDDCYDAVMSHVQSDGKEIGGLLSGWVFSPDIGCGLPKHPIVFVTRSVPTLQYRNSPVSLEMDTEIWSRVGECLTDGTMVVGWYHSHPNLGAFFSSTDRYTQRSFFYHDYSLGWVIDPHRTQQKIFVGANSEEYLHNLISFSRPLPSLAQS